MSRQLTLFGSSVKKTPNFVVYRFPSNGYENFVERFCLRKSKEGNKSSKKDLYQMAQKMWKERYSQNKEELHEFMTLLPDELPFKRLE